MLWCRPINLPWEFTTVLIVRLYISPSANAKKELWELYRAFSELQNTQHVFLLSLWIPAMQISNQYSCNSISMWNLQQEGQTCSIFFTQTFQACTGQSLAATLAIQTICLLCIQHTDHSWGDSNQLWSRWEPGQQKPSHVLLSYCFEINDWHMFRDAATNCDRTKLKDFMSSVTSYISTCISDVRASKTIITCTTQKLWLTAEMWELLRTQDPTLCKWQGSPRTGTAKQSRAIRAS